MLHIIYSIQFHITTCNRFLSSFMLFCHTSASNPCQEFQLSIASQNCLSNPPCTPTFRSAAVLGPQSHWGLSCLLWPAVQHTQSSVRYWWRNPWSQRWPWWVLHWSCAVPWHKPCLLCLGWYWAPLGSAALRSPLQCSLAGSAECLLLAERWIHHTSCTCKMEYKIKIHAFQTSV